MAEFTQRSSNVFRVANLIAIFLVVAIHYNSKHYINVGSALSLNYYFQEWFTNSAAELQFLSLALPPVFSIFLSSKKSAIIGYNYPSGGGR